MTIDYIIISKLNYNLLQKNKMATAKQTLSVSNIILIFSHNIYLVCPTLFQKKKLEIYKYIFHNIKHIIFILLILDT